MKLPDSVGQIQFYFFVQVDEETMKESDLDHRQLDLYLEKLIFGATFRLGGYSVDHSYSPPRYEALIWIYVQLQSPYQDLQGVENELVRVLLDSGWKIRIPGSKEILG